MNLTLNPPSTHNSSLETHLQVGPSGQIVGVVDLDGGSLGMWAATVATFCPNSMMEHSNIPNLSQRNPNTSADGPPCTINVP